MASSQLHEIHQHRRVNRPQRVLRHQLQNSEAFGLFKMGYHTTSHGVRMRSNNGAFNVSGSGSCSLPNPISKLEVLIGLLQFKMYSPSIWKILIESPPALIPDLSILEKHAQLSPSLRVQSCRPHHKWRCLTLGSASGILRL